MTTDRQVLQVHQKQAVQRAEESTRASRHYTPSPTSTRPRTR